MFRLGSFAVIFDAKGAVLLCHRTDIDAWNLPGGRVELGEPPWDAAIRETREEVGLEVEVVRLAGVYAKPEEREIVFSFVCRATGGNLRASDEADEIRFFSVERLPPNTVQKQVVRIHDALAETERPVLREQGGPSTRQLVQQGLWPPS